MTEPIWEEPPVDCRPTRGFIWADQLPALRSNPGTWAKVHTYENRGSAYAAAGIVRKGSFAAAEVGDRWEAKASKGALYVRFMGTASESEAA